MSGEAIIPAIPTKQFLLCRWPGCHHRKLIEAYAKIVPDDLDQHQTGRLYWYCLGHEVNCPYLKSSNIDIGIGYMLFVLR